MGMRAGTRAKARRCDFGERFVLCSWIVRVLGHLSLIKGPCDRICMPAVTLVTGETGDFIEGIMEGLVLAWKGLGARRGLQ